MAESVRAIGPGIPTAPAPSAGAVSGVMTTNIAGAIVDVSDKVRAVFQFAWTAGSTGQFGVKQSAEYDRDEYPTGLLTPMVLGTAGDLELASTGAAGSAVLSVDLFGQTALQPFFTHGSGTGGAATCTVRVED